MKFQALFLFYLIFCSGCSRNTLLEECTTSTGPRRQEIRNLPVFNEVQTNGNLNIFWHEAEEYKVRIEGGRNLLEQVRTSVENSCLKIENKNRCNWVRSFAPDIQVHIYGNQLRLLEIKGFGQIKTLDTLKSDVLYLRHYGASSAHFFLKTRELFVDLNGVGVLELSGESQWADFHAMSVGKLRAWDFRVENLRVHQRGQSPMQVSAAQKLSGIIESEADVLLKGRPEIDVDIRSKARILLKP